jgi:hypothetical protein
VSASLERLTVKPDATLNVHCQYRKDSSEAEVGIRDYSKILPARRWRIGRRLRHSREWKRLCRLGLAGVTLRLLLAARSIGWPMLGGQDEKAPRWRWRRQRGVLSPKRQLHGDRAGGHHPTRARGLKELTLNSSILVAAPRWRRLCRCLKTLLAPAHRQASS